jgi:hypothetical protein
VEYFFIAGNVASVAAFIGFILQIGHLTPDSNIFRYTLGIGIILLLIFWIYFYLLPSNRVRKAIRDRIDFAGSYVDSSDLRIEVYEDDFVLPNGRFDPIIVPLPPFEDQPIVTLYRAGPVSHSAVPRIERITLDSFEVSASSSDAWGVWRFRARGRQLSRVERKNVTS